MKNWIYRGIPETAYPAYPKKIYDFIIGTMSEAISKSYPGNYPSDAVAILDAMSFTDGKSMKLLGSMAVRSQQYAGDFDGYEIVKLNESSEKVALDKLAAKFKDIIKRLKAMKNVFIGDCKAGSIEEWRVIPKEAGIVDGNLVGFNALGAEKKLDDLVRAKVISPAEAKSAREVLKSPLTSEKFLVAKQTIKFHIVRWTPSEILAGHKRLRDGRTFTLQDAFSSPTITKLDVIGMVQNNRFTEFSVIYEFQNGGKILNPDDIDIVRSLQENILYYKANNNPFKVLKRRFALAKFQNKLDEIKRLTPVLNSDLGRIYMLIGDIDTLITLLEEYNPPMKDIRFEIDQFKGRLSNIYDIDSLLKAEPDLLGRINSTLKSSSKEQMVSHLTSIRDTLQGILTRHTPKLKGGALYISKLKMFQGFDPAKATPEEQGAKLAELKQLEQLLRDLAHYYTKTDAYASAFYRSLADDIYRQAPLVQGQPPRKLDPVHQYSEDWNALGAIEGNTKFDSAQDVWDAAKPRALKVFNEKPANLVPAPKPNLWSIPMKTIHEAYTYLGNHPEYT